VFTNISEKGAVFNMEEDQAGDLLRGAEKIAAFLRELGEDVKPEDVYYLRRSGKCPIGKHYADLIASKRQLSKHARKISTIVA
jgi:hypothetical protein